ncbi:MAG TPA: PQQ-dependent sugar dehydrogenase [Thermoanaerobaculia bacterium]|nr:PQQ-dependent sugar dehydrogenase [Thermoanaerobaculia bacterium]
MKNQRVLHLGLSLCLLALSGLRPAVAATLPPGFTNELVASVPLPTAMAFLPDGRLLVSAQTGGLYIVRPDGTLVPGFALDFRNRVCSNRERGLVGIGVDPEFEANRFIYLYYTQKNAGSCPAGEHLTPSFPVNRLSRFVLPPGKDVIDPASEKILLNNIPSVGGYHNSGDIHFGPDGYLYVSVGDGGCDYAGNSGCQNLNDAARDSHIVLGKILRITRDGGIPPDNPYQGAQTESCAATARTKAGWKCRETFASGLRNPFRFSFDPNSSEPRFFINDVGGNAVEEINEGGRGLDYGWNCREGNGVQSTRGACSPAPTGVTPPVFGYAHRTKIPWSTGAGWPNGVAPANCHAVTGSAFVPDGVWPGFDGVYLFSDFVCGGIFALRPAGERYVASDFVTALGANSAVALLFGPESAEGRALYYTTYAEGGQIRRIRYTGGSGNHAPTATLAATPLGGPLPLTVTFNATGSQDPDAGDTVTYGWDFGDGTAAERTSQPTVQHTYTKAGTFTATLRVRDNHGAVSVPATAQISPGNTPPVPEILTPTPGQLFTVGENVVLSGRAQDAEDGPFAGARLSWTVLLHHNNDHTHPYLGPVSGNNRKLIAPPPEDLFAAPQSRLEIRLTATDSQGLSATVSQFFEPKRVQLTFQTNPAGLQLLVGGVGITGPATVTSWEGYAFPVDALPLQIVGGQVNVFQSWSDGGAATHTITTPPGGATYTANFTAAADAALPLRSGRFQVAVSWKTPEGQAGAGHAVPLTADSGLFWFFNQANIELIVKVLDGCGVNNHYWVFAGGLTDVEATVVVTDTTTGASRTYTNPQGTAFKPVQDTQAFASCP